MASVEHFEAMNVILKSAKYSDLILACNGQDFHVTKDSKWSVSVSMSLIAAVLNVL